MDEDRDGLPVGRTFAGGAKPMTDQYFSLLKWRIKNRIREVSVLDKYDQDGDGLLSRAETIAMMKDLKIMLSQEELDILKRDPTMEFEMLD